MSLRRQSLSPTANLLRNSRLFALPNPLPRPLVAESFGAGNLKASDTATLPYPTHQAIASTPSSRARGDWGLKRPLPARSRILKKSNPVVRVTQWDTIEEITDFDSAADHVRTRQKFEELGVPVLKGMSQFAENDITGAPPKSAFEGRADVTAYDVEAGLDGAGIALSALKESIVATQKKLTARRAAAKDSEKPAPTETTYTPPTLPAHANQLPNLRWKHEGPWLPGMGAEEFEAYVSKELAARKKEFNWYLVNYVKGQLYASRSSLSRRTETIPMDTDAARAWEAAKEKEWTRFTRADIAKGIQSLREKCAADPLNSDLVQKLIIPFLRLPPIKVKATNYSQTSYNEVGSQRFADETTPNTTHPSAGLGYLRTKAYLANHPILGPQALPTPVTARVIQPRATKARRENVARLGVAGFVTNDDVRENLTSHGVSNQSGAMLDVDTEGGAKVTVQPLFAAVSPEGKVHIKVKRSYGPELQVARGQLEDRPPARLNAESNPLSSLMGGRSGGGEKKMAQEEFEDLLRGIAKEEGKSS